MVTSIFIFLNLALTCFTTANQLLCPINLHFLWTETATVDINVYTTHSSTQLPVMACSTYDGAKQAQTGGVALPRVTGALLPGWGQGYTQADGSVKLAPSRLHSDHRAKVCLITQQLRNQLIWNWLSLNLKVKDVERAQVTQAKM